MKILVTGGAGFIGSNLVDHFLSLGHQVVCLDNLSTGHKENIRHNFSNPNFKFIQGDVRDFEICRKAVECCDYVSHQAALGSVPRSISDPSTTNSVNINGFLNVIIAARDAGVKKFVFASSSSVYGDSLDLPKIEEKIGRPLSPYAVTKHVNEIYAEVFAKTYGMQCIGLRYFNVFGRRQDPNGVYAAVIPLWVKQLIKHERPIINGDGSYSRDFTYIDNVIQANEKALFTPMEKIIQGKVKYYNSLINQSLFIKHHLPVTDNQNTNSFSEVFNIAYGGSTTLLDLFRSIRKNLSEFDKEIANIAPVFGANRIGDIHHSLASILKAKTILNYRPEFNAEKGVSLAVEWYYNNIH